MTSRHPDTKLGYSWLRDPLDIFAIQEAVESSDKGTVTLTDGRSYNYHRTEKTSRLNNHVLYWISPARNGQYLPCGYFTREDLDQRLKMM